MVGPLTGLKATVKFVVRLGTFVMYLVQDVLSEALAMTGMVVMRVLWVMIVLVVLAAMVVLMVHVGLV